MTDQIGTPGSNADTSVNGGKAGAPKDKQCPFCNQPFTSSSLGRHLDLYIKEKNPKPADGIHHVDEIRKLRGGITRRQPRNSSSKREDSTPVGTPGPPGRSPPESEATGHISPSLSRYPPDLTAYTEKGRWLLNKGSWESTGVMNNIPPPRNGDAVRAYDGEERELVRRADSRNRSVSKQILAKSTFDQKQKMLDAQDRARAAELALRELLGGIRAAKQRIDGPSILDYDPMTFDFPSLVLHCLPPPPTLYKSHPLPTATSWSILPPDDQQYEGLRKHFSGEIHRWRVSCAVASTVPQDDLSYPPRPMFNHFDNPAEVAQRAEAAANDLESKISNHLHEIYKHWTSLIPQTRSELWTLELARSVGRKSESVRTLKAEKELAQQEATHLRLQVDELSRLQHPREFRLDPPKTLPMDSNLMSELAENGMGYSSIGFSLSDRNLHLDDMVERVIGRWNGVVKESRGGQRSLSGDSSATMHHPASALPKPALHHSLNINQNHAPHAAMTNGRSDDPDADADADMEEDDSFVEMNNSSHVEGQRNSNAGMTQAANFRLTNGLGNGNVMDGLENPASVQGYGRIGS